MQNLAIITTQFLDLFARGGGGGSGGGGGGGGGSGGGGDGIIFVVGYLPTWFVGKTLRKHMKNPVGLAITAVFTLVYGVFWWYFGVFGFLISLGAFLGGPAGYFGWFGKISARIRKKAKKEITEAASKDPAWNEEELNNRVKDVFLQFQKDWSTFDLTSMQSYLSPKYKEHIYLMMAAIKLRQRENLVDNPQVIEWFPVDVDDFASNAEDKVTYYVNAKAEDKIIENIDGQKRQLFEDKAEFQEYWHFIRDGNKWLLDNISQQTENGAMLRQDLKDFALQNGMYYSPDWGWLLLPRRGQLFNGGQFGRSDINNHIIGEYKDILVELYTYIKNYNNDKNPVGQLLVAQVALPKRYDSLIVKAKESFWSDINGYFAFSRVPKGYNQVSLEWPDFNKRYDVFATNVEQVTVFELLHPVFMEKLFALPFKVSIEVVDNVVYLYSKDKKADYQTMFSVLKDAFQEMKL